MSLLPSSARRALNERPNRVLFIAGAGAFMGPLDVTVVAVALPALGDALGLSFSAGLWVQAGYLLSYALVLIPAGRLADQWGRLAVWRLGVLAFIVGSLGAGLATGPEPLIAWRLLQGVGGGLLAATGTALVSAVFPPERRGRALGLTIMALYLGLSVGPLIGGLLIDHAGWRWIFLVNVPVGLGALAFSSSLTEARPHLGRPRSISGRGAAGCRVVGLLVGITFAPLWGWSSPRSSRLSLAARCSRRRSWCPSAARSARCWIWRCSGAAVCTRWATSRAAELHGGVRVHRAHGGAAGAGGRARPTTTGLIMLTQRR